MSLQETAEKLAAQGESSRRPARDVVNQAMVNNWVEALGDANPVYTDPAFAAASVHKGLVAPPAMAQVWTMNGLHGTRAADDPLGAMMEELDGAGFTSVVATNSEQTYHRYLRHGELVSATTRLENAAGPKRTALGEGWFVTTRTIWYVGDEVVAEMMFRVLKFAPPDAKPPAAPVLRPVISLDTAFFWEGLKAGELRIQRWGDVLRHPPGPMPPDGALDAVPDYVVASGLGTVHSYVVHHHPPLPGKELPFVVALVELDEGVRVLAELLDVPPGEVHIGQRVEAAFVHVDDDLTLPAWRLAR
ncbi:bifunctional MaoC family dehydratase N-terminal/OB-fold nucleic acid binding domain-containing protein [Amycolatopsis sp. H20-H5]|uniref:bifunctional MaoC family dehydratase N-terminal/OB-fold nucleic acid binding domain-containing protein n=1 Tax=Amycolatopsis sp. H20-H5 TaxID=3046309 RepID=UPI002DB76F29|nr:OB-fold domain-containing protein [Amycolatopsis sp. H20-H5]MEC3977127.1 OB-fold domain-containing protein [Amycolatopsis sp. H20-H5]